MGWQAFKTSKVAVSRVGYRFFAGSLKVFCISLVLALAGRSAYAENPILNKYRLGEGLTFTNGDGYSLKISGYLQPYAEFKTYVESEQSDFYQRFRLRRLRLRISGKLAQEKVSYRLQIDLSGYSETGAVTSNLLMDAFISYNFTRTLKASFGQRSTFTDNRELFMRSQTLQLVERSRVTSSFAAIREFGLFIEDRVQLGQSGQYVKPYFVVTNGDGPNAFAKDHGGIKVGGRVDYLPFGLFYKMGQFRQADIVRELTPRLVIGLVYSYNWGMSNRRGRTSGEILYLDMDGNESLPSFGKYGVDFLFKYKGFSALGEFNKTYAHVPEDITQRVRNDGSVSTTFTGGAENYVKGRMMLGEGYNLQAGYMFTSGFSLDGRYCHIKADENSFLNNGTFYNRQNYYTVGASQYFQNNYGLKIQISLTYVDALEGSNDIDGEPMSGNELMGRLMTTLAF